MRQSKLLGISGLARSGKDTFATALIRELASLRPGLKIARYAFANALKKSCIAFCWDNFGINSFTEKTREKEIIRPFLIGLGTSARIKNPRHWIEIVEKQIAADSPDVAIITDVRFAESDNDELDWIKKNGRLVHIARKENGKFCKPPNPEEKKNDPLLKKAADFRVKWDTLLENPEELEKTARNKAAQFIHIHSSFLFSV